LSSRFRKLSSLVAALAACLASGLVGGGANLAPDALAARVGACTPGADWGTAQQQLAPPVVKLVNAHRSLLGLSQLGTSPTLTASALWKARHMAKYGYFGHDDPAPPVARTVFQRIAACGYSGAWVGENIAAGFQTPETVMQAWLLSPGHRANLEAPRWTVIGVGVARSSTGVLYWVQDFGSDADSSAENRRPIARADRRSVEQNHEITIGVLRNDRDPDGDTLTVAGLKKAPRHGRAWVVAGSELAYQPAPGFVGRDRFRYEVTDGRGAYSSAAVIVRVKR
jgi:uncharacterized protein YkwD